DIKSPDKFTFAGKPMPRVDVIHKIDGSARFGMDAQVPGMVFAEIQQCPVPGGTLKSVDESPAQGAPGVIKVVKLDNAVAVVATGTFWRAKQALAKLQPEWDVGAAGNVDSVGLSKEFHAALDGPAVATTNAAVYETQYSSHSLMETINATVHLQTDRLDEWFSTPDELDGTED